MAVKKVPCSISISKALLEQIRELAQTREESRSEVIERFIREGLKRESRREPRL